MTAVGVRQVRSRLRRLRRRHHGTSFDDFLTDLYLLALLAALYGWAFVDMSRDFLGSALVRAGDPAEQRWLVAAAVLTAAGFGWAGLRVLGPVFVGPALQSWVASAPIDRRRLLLPRFAGLLTGASAVVALLGFLFGVLSRIAADAPALEAGIVDATLLGAAIGLLAGAAAVVAQGARRARWAVELPGRVLIGAGALVAGTVVVLHFGPGTPMPRPDGTVPLAVPALVFVAAATAVVFAVRALRRLDRATTTTGAQFASRAAAAAVMLDPTLIADLLEARRWRALGRVRSRRFRSGPRWWALTQAELRRAVRRRGALLGWAALVLVQYAVALAVPGLAGPAQVLTAFLAGDRLAGGLRAITRSPGLRRALGGGDTGLKLAHLAGPALAAALFLLVTAPVAGGRPAWADAVLLLGVGAAVYRSGTRPALVYDGPVVETPFGLIPVDLLRQLWRGWDVVALLIVVDLIATR
ncbi:MULTISPECIES: DUF6297 family protein [Catenuloplanes]|uniref:Uncharacterized protein n=1 Tax=Catenuloplanes niger TaxID=587534 RepID=A0AAE3ZMN9_9ACTN|nr:DUF6297 family protein [Catenuloplanes niger]MDR7321440.1 hypothetical protein [Catenuloplanes niger]